ncbi:hypothetical protein L3X38_009346 [Prunus dulcis]|uniref:Uncharacterized protein n=1 Tax=Prunus dulcis TaxID=3755 RepID=A0AAD4ZYW4_PRUDU|nr:hypothetical protein L3X38_009346 [Prunus dulcis]
MDGDGPFYVAGIVGAGGPAMPYLELGVLGFGVGVEECPEYPVYLRCGHKNFSFQCAARCIFQNMRTESTDFTNSRALQSAELGELGFNASDIVRNFVLEHMTLFCKAGHGLGCHGREQMQVKVREGSDYQLM